MMDVSGERSPLLQTWSTVSEGTCAKGFTFDGVCSTPCCKCLGVPGKL